MNLEWETWMNPKRRRFMISDYSAGSRSTYDMEPEDDYLCTHPPRALPLEVGDWVEVGTEVMLVIGHFAGRYYDVVRGYGGTTPARHPAGTTVGKVSWYSFIPPASSALLRPVAQDSSPPAPPGQSPSRPGA